MVSGTFSLPYSGYFSPFPHGTSSLSVSQEYLALPDGAGSFSRCFTSADLLRILTSLVRLLLKGFHLLGLVFPDNSNSLTKLQCQSYNPTTAVTLVVWAIPHSLATTNGITIVFSSSGYLDVSVPQVCFSMKRDVPTSSERVTPFGNPRIKSYNQSPWLIAAYHVLHRL